MNIEQRITLWMELHPEPCEELDLLNDASEQLATCRALLRECSNLLVEHHESSRCTFPLGEECPVCSYNHTQTYPNNIFGRIEQAARAAGGE